MMYVTKTQILRMPNGAKIYEAFAKENTPVYENGTPNKRTIAYTLESFEAFMSSHPEVKKIRKSKTAEAESASEEIGLLRGQIFDMDKKIDQLIAKVNYLLDDAPSHNENPETRKVCYWSVEDIRLIAKKCSSYRDLTPIELNLLLDRIQDNLDMSNQHEQITAMVEEYLEKEASHE